MYNAANKPNFPPTKDRWTTLDSMSFQSKAMKTITVSTPNQECIGCEFMCVGTAAKLEQRPVNFSRKVICVEQQKVGLCCAFILEISEMLLYRTENLKLL